MPIELVNMEWERNLPKVLRDTDLEVELVEPSIQEGKSICIRHKGLGIELRKVAYEKPTMYDFQKNGCAYDKLCVDEELDKEGKVHVYVLYTQTNSSWLTRDAAHDIYIQKYKEGVQ